MTTEWNNRAYRFNPSGGDSKGSFQGHDRQMRDFRMSHADVALVNGPRLNETAFMESLPLLRVSDTKETGGSAPPDDTTDRSQLVPVWKVARYKLSQN